MSRGTTYRVLVITAEYPQRHAPEKGFILEELRELVRSGLSVTLAPIRTVTDIDQDLPEGIELTNLYSRAFSLSCLPMAFLRSLILRDVWREILTVPRQIGRVRFWKEAIRVAQAQTIFRKHVGSYEVYYTFWFTGDTIGLAKAGVRSLVTRAHGYDLYEELPVNGGHIPFRRWHKDAIATVVTLSEQARRYAIAQFDTPEAKVVSIPLGVPVQDYFNPGCHLADEVTFLSCAFPSANKRLGTIGKVISEFSEQHPHLRVIWHHIGADASKLELARQLPSNLTVEAWGKIPRDQILNFYRNTGVSFFINLSLSEGQPVSVMEAMSFGVPVVATAVGGVPEMLEHGGGILVDIRDTPSQIAMRIASLMSEPGWRQAMGEAAAAIQTRQFNARRNAERFNALLHGVAERSSV